MKTPEMLRKIPSVNDLLESPPLKGMIDRVSHNVVADGVRSFLDDMRGEIEKRAAEYNIPPMGELADRIARRILQGDTPRLRPVINATGILLHTGLGRAPLAEEAIAEMVAAARDYASVEIDLATGERSHRIDAVSALLTERTGAEAAVVVNNNAGATMIALAALAAGREVIVSRGQLIEIGGSYRLPDVMSASGATLREVGTTNKTRARDYEAAIGEKTAALMRVHTSNYRVVGFTEEASLAELVKLGRKHSLPVIDDIGSGAVIDLAKFGFQHEPVARASIAAGADLVLFSGDKLLGGPQCGIIVGRKKYVDVIHKHPMARALRVDKITLSALAATLRLYRDESKAAQSIPLLQLLGTPLDNLENRARRLAPQLEAAAAIESAEPIEDVSHVGGGSLPTEEIKTWCLALTPAGRTVDQLAATLRTGQPAVMGRVQKNQLLLDLRSVFPRQDQDIVSAIQKVGSPDS